MTSPIDNSDEPRVPYEEWRKLNRPAPDRTATGILDAAAQHMRDRAATYDQPQGERSAGKIADAFNAITGRAAERAISESEAWLFLVILKLVRDRSRALPHPDSLEDSVAYASLMAEARFKEVPVPQALCDVVNDDEPVLLHAELRKTYCKGQQWQYKNLRSGNVWRDCIGSPAWSDDTEYQLKEDPLPHAELRKTYREGQQWEFKLQSAPAWSDCSGEPLWTESTTYRLKPDVLQPVLPHVELRKIYHPGQRWECLPFSENVWQDCVTWCDDAGSKVPTEPQWDVSTLYRLKTAV